VHPSEVQVMYFSELGSEAENIKSVSVKVKDDMSYVQSSPKYGHCPLVSALLLQNGPFPTGLAGGSDLPPPSRHTIRLGMTERVDCKALVARPLPHLVSPSEARNKNVTPAVIIIVTIITAIYLKTKLFTLFIN